MPAGAAWLGAGLTSTLLNTRESLVLRHELAQRSMWAAGLFLGLMCVLLVAMMARVVGRQRTWSIGGRAGPVTGLVIGLAMLLLGSVAASMSTASLTADPVGAWVDARATVTVAGVVTTEPRVRVMRGAPVWQQSTVLEARMATSAISARGVAVSIDLPLVLRLAAGQSAPPPGTPVHVTGRLAPLSAPTDATATLIVRTIAAVPGEAPGPVDVVAHAMRSGLTDALQGTPPDAGSLVAGLAVGDESGQPAELGEQMRSSGLSHLTAVSGGNVAIVLAVVIGAVVVLRLPLVARLVAALLALAYFLILVGPQPSVLRACAMGAIATVGLLTGGRRAGPSVLGAGVLLLVLLAPWLATSWGFALSAVATGGLILLAPLLSDRLESWPRTRRWPPGLREAVSLTGAAQLATLPVLVAMGGTVGWVGLPANLLVMPVVPAITVLGLAAAGVSPLLPAVAAVIAHLAAWPAAWIALVARTASGLPLAAPTWPTGWAGLGVLSGLGLAAITIVRVRQRFMPEGMSPPVRAVAIVALAGTLVVSILQPPSRRGWPPEGWLLIMCDVGQGDALVVRTGPGEAVVVDAGPEPDAVDRCLTEAHVTTVPAVVLTHFHADHVGGLTGVLRGRSVAEVLVNPIRDPVEEATNVDRVLQRAGVAEGVITAGDTRVVGDASWRAIWPRRRIDAGSVPNNASVVLVLTVAGRNLLLTGDVEPEAQAALAGDVRGIAFDVVKVPHHGSRNQSSLLTSWAPAPVALISVGAGNDYGHPAVETIAAWAAIGALVARTDRDGDVAVVAAGTGVGVVTRRGMLPSS